MPTSGEKIFLFQCENEDVRLRYQNVCRSLNIPLQFLPPNAGKEKIGYLIGRKGFQPATADDREEEFDFLHEVMLFQNIKNKRLDEVLAAFRKENLPHIRYKAVITAFNTLWTLQRLCRTMEREHREILLRKANLESDDDKKDKE